MTHNPNDHDKMRKAAEAQFGRSRVKLVEPRPGEDLLHELLHELRVHQIELGMQNESLRQAQEALEESRDRYVNLYEFSPVSYLTLSLTGEIEEINLTGATLLGEERKNLLHRRFSKFVVAEDQDKWNRYFIRALKEGSNQSCELHGVRKSGTAFKCYLGSRVFKTGNEVTALHITLTDITKQIWRHVVR